MQTSSCKHGDNYNYSQVQPYNKPRRPSAQRKKSPHTPRRHRGKRGRPRAPTPTPRRRGNKGNANVDLIARPGPTLCIPCDSKSFEPDSDRVSMPMGQSAEGVSQGSTSSCCSFYTGRSSATSQRRTRYDDGSLAPGDCHVCAGPTVSPGRVMCSVLPCDLRMENGTSCAREANASAFGASCRRGVPWKRHPQAHQQRNCYIKDEVLFEENSIILLAESLESCEW